MTRILYGIMFLLIINNVLGQKVTPLSLTTAGDSYSFEGGDIAISIGDPVSAYYQQNNIMITQGFFTPSLISVTGKLSYININNTPIHSSTIWLQRNNLIIKTSLTNNEGEFAFTDLLPGNYIMIASSDLPFGGINSADALIVMKHFVHLTTLTGLTLQAADIDGNGYVNASDAFSITKRFNGLLNSFPVGDWQFEAPGFSISTHGNYFYNIHALCTGDVNGSFIPQ